MTIRTSTHCRIFGLNYITAAHGKGDHHHSPTRVKLVLEAGSFGPEISSGDTCSWVNHIHLKVDTRTHTHNTGAADSHFDSEISHNFAHKGLIQSLCMTTPYSLSDSVQSIHFSDHTHRCRRSTPSTTSNYD